MRKNLIIMSLLLFAAACGKLADEQAENHEERVIGKWKLVKVDIPFVGESNDYSQYDIMYEFKTNGVLSISGETEQIELYRGHELGEHLYSFVDDDYGLEPFGLKIDNFYSWYQISLEELIINGSPVDGFIYYFIKTNY